MLLAAVLTCVSVHMFLLEKCMLARTIHIFCSGTLTRLLGEVNGAMTESVYPASYEGLGTSNQALMTLLPIAFSIV